MSIASDLRSKLRIPVMAGPLFIASTADLVIAQCNAGIIGSMPATDIVTTNCFTGVDANFLKPSLIEHGLDPANLKRAEGKSINININIDGGGENAKAWKEIWSAGQGIGTIKRAEPAKAYIDQLAAEYAVARELMGMTA